MYKILKLSVFGTEATIIRFQLHSSRPVEYFTVVTDPGVLPCLTHGLPPVFDLAVIAEMFANVEFSHDISFLSQEELIVFLFSIVSAMARDIPGLTTKTRTHS